MLLQLVPILGIQSEIAIELLRRSSGPASIRGLAPSCDAHLHRLTNQGTTQCRDEEARSIRVTLGMRCVGKPHHVSRVFDHQVLEAAASSDERNVVFPRESYAGQRSVDAAIRTAGA